VPLSLIATLSTVSAVFLFGMSMVLLRARRRPVVSGADALVGSIGVVIDDAPADGWATVRRQWRIHSAAGAWQRARDGAARAGARRDDRGRPVMTLPETRGRV
jgi:membrane-bound ClpP family serine protease